ncbi:MAG: branched-chain amino acid transaminase [Thermoplasmataceae archaeon]
MQGKVWLDGKIVDYDSVNVPILTHSLQYGTGIFEGIRAYEDSGKASIFRLGDHIRRFQDTARVYHMNLGFSAGELTDAVIEVVKENNLKACYIRPFAYYASDDISLSTRGKRISVAIAAVPFGQYFGDKLSRGVKCRVSSWKRINSDILPVQAKASGNYLNSIIASMDVEGTDFDEVILLSSRGYVAEGPGENIFLVRNGRLLTPGTESDILLGITRSSVIEIAKNLGIETEEREVHREELYTADEAFFCGTAAEITPVVNVDGISVGNGKKGAITSKLQNTYFDAVSGRLPEYRKWLTTVR